MAKEKASNPTRIGPVALALREKKKAGTTSDADALDAAILELQEQANRKAPTIEEIKKAVRTEINSALASAGRG